MFRTADYFSFNVTHSTVHVSVTKVANALAELESTYIQWPTEEEMALEEATFFSRYGK